MSKLSRGHTHHDGHVSKLRAEIHASPPRWWSQQGEFLSVQFKSKQTGRWGVLRVPIELVFRGDTHREAWDAEMAQRPREHKDAMVQMTARIASQRGTAQSH